VCCAQQTGMHILVVEALLVATYSTWGWTNTYTHRKSCRPRTCLVRIADPCPAGTYERTSVRAYEPANSHRYAAYSQHSVPAHSRQERSTSLRHPIFIMTRYTKFFEKYVRLTLHISYRRPTKGKEWISFKLKRNGHRRLNEYMEPALARHC
jgi:hypothetical protein